MIEITKLQKEKQVFFISDLHLPLWFSGGDSTTHLEDKVLAWLDYIAPQAEALFLLGDIFDFWFEYRYLVPKGAIRFQTKLWTFHQKQIPVYFFLGNHDGWAIDYLTQACGVQLFRKPASITICNKRFLVGHGDTIDPPIHYAIVRKLYTSALLQSIARVIPADWLYGVVCRYLLRRKEHHKKKEAHHSVFEEKERIFRYCKEQIEPFSHHDFYIFGHTHLPCIKEVNDSSHYCNLGDWISHDTYGCFDGLTLSLRKF